MFFTADGGRHVDKHLKIIIPLLGMKSKDFVSAVQSGKVQVPQTLGIIRESEGRPLYFMVGVLNDAKITCHPNDSCPTSLGMNFLYYSKYQFPTNKVVQKGWVGSTEPSYVTVHDEKDTIYCNRTEFEDRMGELMKNVKPKRNFSFFTIDLSKIEW
jgi:hypothetical protein